MDSYNSLINEILELKNEIQVDYGTTLQKNFNPLLMTLKLSSNSQKRDFLEMKGRIEKLISELSTYSHLIANSLTNFVEFRKENQEILNIHNAVEDVTVKMKNTRLSQHKNIVVNDEIFKFCLQIFDLRNSYNMYFRNIGLDDKTTQLNKCLLVLDDEFKAKAVLIKGLREYCHKIQKSFQEHCALLNESLFNYIFDDEIQNLYHFQLILKMQSIDLFDQHCITNYENCLSNSLLNKNLEEIAFKLRRVLENTHCIVGKCQDMFQAKQEEDFFGKKRSKEYFIMDFKNSIRCIENVLMKFKRTKKTIQPYELLEENLDLKSIYGDHVISKRFEMTADQTPRNITYSINNGTIEDFHLLSVEMKKQKIKEEIKEEWNQLIEFVEMNADENKIEEILDSMNIFNFVEIYEIKKISKFNKKIENDFTNNVYKIFLDKFKFLFKSEFIKSKRLNEILTKKNYSMTNERLSLSISDFKDLILDINLKKDSLLLDYTETRKYICGIKKINTNGEFDLLIKIYEECLANQILFDFMYYYDLFYRQGHYTYYLKQIFKILTSLEDDPILFLEDILEFYSIKNVYLLNCKNQGDLDSFISNLEILREIFNDFEFYFTFSGIMGFFKDRVNIDKYDSKYLRILNQRLGESRYGI